MTTAIDEVSSIHILGTKVHIVEIPDVIKVMDHWIQSEPETCHYIVNTGMHGIMTAHRDPGFKEVLNSADLFVPDGILVILVARLRGFFLRKRMTGPGLMWEFGETAGKKGHKYFIYGDTEDTLQALAAKLTEAYPGLKIVGLHAPPFRPLTPEEDEAVVRAINNADPDVLWVGLGAPKQERWIYEHRSRLKVPVVVGVGAALKYHSGMVRRAPSWIRNSGFEWLWRLLQEPGRVWRRVLIDAPQFLGLVALELSHLKKYG